MIEHECSNRVRSADRLRLVLMVLEPTSEHLSCSELMIFEYVKALAPVLSHGFSTLTGCQVSRCLVHNSHSPNQARSLSSLNVANL
jgi:hypothetical protein